MAYHTLTQLLFAEDSICTSLKLLLLSAKHAHDDVTGYVCGAMVRNPVAFAFTEFGVAPYSAHADLVIPYDNMTRRQLQAALELCAETEASGSSVACSKMHTGFFVQHHSLDRYYVPSARVFAAFDALLAELHVPQATRDLTMHRLRV